MIELILQGTSPNDSHLAQVQQLLARHDLNEFLVSVAFLRRSGVQAVRTQLSNISGSLQLYVGIRNGVTSVQGVIDLLKIGIQPYAVDTAAPHFIFHPKVYAGSSDRAASLIVGSANLTEGGLIRNLEASVSIELNLRDNREKAIMEKLTQSLGAMPADYPQHVFKIRTIREAVQLMRQGRLADERVQTPPNRTSSLRTKHRDQLSAMRPLGRPVGIAPRPAAQRPSRQRTRSRAGNPVLVWESKPLTERSLNIPRQPGTHATGDFNLTQGNMPGLDFKSYFRTNVFSGLNWTNRPGAHAHLERATISAEIVLRNYSYGNHQLEVTHDPRTNTASYRQNNAMTKIKWGQTSSIIARRDLLDGTLKLYKKSNTEFIIELS